MGRVIVKTPEDELVEFLRRQKGKIIKYYIGKEARDLYDLRELMQEGLYDYIKENLEKRGKKVPNTLSVVMPYGGFSRIKIEEDIFEQPIVFKILVRHSLVATGEMTGYGEYWKMDSREGFRLMWIVFEILQVY